MGVITVNKNNFDTEVLTSDKPVIVDFWAPWCGYCRSIAPMLEEIAQEHNDVKVVKVNVDEEQELSKKYQIMSLPTLIVIKKGEITNQAMGSMPKKQILSLLQ